MFSFDEVKQLLASPLSGMDAITFTRLDAEGGALHTGGADGIVYAACKIGYLDLPESHDAVADLLCRAPAALAWAVQRIEALSLLADCTGDLKTCPDAECSACAIRECPHAEPMHLHHDGCPACAGPNGGMTAVWMEGPKGRKQHKVMPLPGFGYLNVFGRAICGLLIPPDWKEAELVHSRCHTCHEKDVAAGFSAAIASQGANDAHP